MPRIVSLPALCRALGLALALTAPAGLAHAEKTVPSGRVHVVYPGQTLGMIAKRYNVSIHAICKANGINRKRPIVPKQRLVIPLTPDELAQKQAARPDKPGARAARTLPATSRKRGASGGKSASAKTAKKSRKEQRSRYSGYVEISSLMGSWKGHALQSGVVTGQARDGFQKVLASWRTGKTERIHGRLIRMLVKVSDHFGGKPIRVVSGFRPYRPEQYTPHSRHNIGRAVDFYIPGVKNEEIRDYCRTLYKVGVGYYPNSSFVHLDVRELNTYWIDYSGPGQAPRYAHKQAKRKSPARRSPRARGTGSVAKAKGRTSAQ